MQRFFFLVLLLLAFAGGPVARAQTQANTAKADTARADTELLSLSWEQIEEQARGGEVRIIPTLGSHSSTRLIDD